MSEVVLGKLVAEPQGRDAIHVAVIPAVAREKLKPGQRVGLDNDGEVCSTKLHIGIVDPFLAGNVNPGETFWLCLFPGTVTGMRHHWSHPRFSDAGEAKPKYTKEESEKWLRVFVEQADCPDFDTLIKAATGQDIRCVNEVYYGTYENDGEILFFSGRDAHGDIPDEFWDHVENYTGVKCPLRAKEFSCSC